MANLFVGKKLIMVKLYVVISPNVVSVFVFYIAMGWWGCKKKHEMLYVGTITTINWYCSDYNKSVKEFNTALAGLWH